MPNSNDVIPKFDDEQIDLILKHFRGNRELVAKKPADSNFRPETRTLPLGVDEFREVHLKSDTCLGFYLLNKQDHVHCCTIDIDNHPDQPDPEWRDKAEQIVYFLLEQEIPHVVSTSQSGEGCHITMFFKESVEAWLPRSFFKFVISYLAINVNEIYPRQDKRSGKGLGSLLRYPGFNQSQFIDVEENWKTIFPEFHYVHPEQLQVVCANFGHRLEPEVTILTADGLPKSVAQIVNRNTNCLMSRRFNRDFDGLKDPSDSACVQSLVSACVDAFISPNDIHQTILAYGEKYGWAKAERDDFRDRTIEKGYEYKQKPVVQDATPHHDFLECAIGAVGLAGKEFHMGTGLSNVDDAIDGIALGEFGIIMARPGHGKSIFAQQWLDHAARQGHVGLMLNAEMPWNLIGGRAVTRITGMARESWPDHKERIEQQIHDYYRGYKPPLFKAVTSIDDVENSVRAYKEFYGVKLVVVDYIQLLRNPRGSRYESVTDISQRLKALTIQYNVAILGLAQANREIESRPEPIFTQGDLKESGSLEQDADNVFSLWWHGRGRNDSIPPAKARMQFVKRRNGGRKVQQVDLCFDAPNQTFYPWE
jgi:hypothetical protein